MTKLCIVGAAAASLVVAASALPGCGGDDIVNSVTPKPDGGIKPPDPESDAGAPSDGGREPDGGFADFSDFVKELIANDTNATASPRVVPTESQLPARENPADYPAVLFQ